MLDVTVTWQTAVLLPSTCVEQHAVAVVFIHGLNFFVSPFCQGLKQTHYFFAKPIPMQQHWIEIIGLIIFVDDQSVSLKASLKNTLYF